jgi:hypothetical protein
MDSVSGTIAVVIVKAREMGPNSVALKSLGLKEINAILKQCILGGLAVRVPGC